MNTAMKACLFGGAIFTAGIAQANGTYRIDGPSAVATNSSYYNWDYGGDLSDFRDALSYSYHFRNFNGTVDVVVQTRTFDYLGCCDTIQRADCIISPWWSDTQIAPFEVYVATYHFLNNGKDLLLFNDDSGHDAIAAALGVPTQDSASSSVFSGSTFPFDGPFGTTPSAQASGNIGYLNLADVLNTGGEVLAVNGAGQVTAAFWDDDAFAPGAGRMIIVTDVDTVGTGFGNAVYFPPNNNGRFGLNLVAGLIDPEGCNRADCNRDGQLNFDDIDCFVDNFLGGCP